MFLLSISLFAFLDGYIFIFQWEIWGTKITHMHKLSSVNVVSVSDFDDLEPKGS